MQQASRLIIKPTGEALRGFLTLSIKEHDRHLTRIEAALVTAKSDLSEIEKDTDNRVSRARSRPAHNMGSNLAGIGIGGEVSDLMQAKRHVDQLENTIATLKHSRHQVSWFVEQLVPEERYELSSFDLMSLGVTVVGRGSLHSTFGPDLIGGGY